MEDRSRNTRAIRTWQMEPLAPATIAGLTPRGSGIDDTYELPAEIKRIDVGAGRFTVIQ